MSLFQLNRHHSEDCGASGSECSSAVVILKLSVKTELFEKALGFVKERLVETRAFSGCQKCEIAASKEKSDIIIYQIWDSFEDQKKYVEWRTETGMLETTLNFLTCDPTFFEYDYIGSY